MKNRFSDCSALLFIDFQYCYAMEDNFKTADWQDIVGNAKKILTVGRSRRVPCIFLRMWRDPNGKNAHRHDPRDQKGRPICAVAGTQEAQIVDDLQPGRGDIIVDKQRFSGFFETDLEQILNRMGIKHLIISGVSTEQCVLATVFDAFFRGYDITVVKDACGTGSKAAHMTTILNMANWIYGCRIIAAEQAVKALRDQPFRAWSWIQPNRFAYSAATIEEMYHQI